jgi:hypothetical protein
MNTCQVGILFLPQRFACLAIPVSIQVGVPLLEQLLSLGIVTYLAACVAATIGGRRYLSIF